MKWWKAYGWIVGLVLVICLLFGAVFCFLGNPVSLFLAQKGAEDYVRSRYPGWEITGVGYDFITPKYYAHAGKDGDWFTLHLDGRGHVYFDTYE